jgi:hypothetical protein
MSNLHNLQQNFLSAIYSNDETAITKSIKQSDLSSKAKIQIYRNNVFSSLHKVIEDAFPVIKRLVGKEFFKYLASNFIKEFPMTQQNLEDYGESLEQFLCKFEPAKQLPYLPDMARLEWAFHKAATCEKAATINTNSLSSIKQADYFNLKFTSHPSVSLVSSPYPIGKIWEMNRQSEPEPIDLSKENAAHLLCIHLHKKRTIQVIPINIQEFRFLISLKEGKNLYHTFEGAVALDPDFDLVSTLNKYLELGTFSGYYFA